MNKQLMNQIIIGIDLDGVIADYSHGFSNLLRDMYGLSKPIVHEDDAQDWDWTKWYPVTKKEIQEARDHINNRMGNFWSGLSPIYKEFTYIQDFNDNPNVTVYFLTSRPATQLNSITRQTTTWLAKLGWVNPQVIANDRKEKFVKYLGIKYFVDDKVANCVAVKEENPDCNVYLLERTHNSHIEVPDNIKIISSLEYFVNEVTEGLLYDDNEKSEGMDGE